MFNPSGWLSSLVNNPTVDTNALELLFEKLKAGDKVKSITQIEKFSQSSQCIQVFRP
jgi:hypothetical protein